MKKVSEGKRMWTCVMGIFLVYAIIFILFEDYDKHFLQPFDEVSDWHLLLFSIVVMLLLGWLLYRYAHRMDERISREQLEQQNEMRRQLTQNIAHELKTPVASILGYTDTILDNPDITDETKQQFIQRTNAQARRLMALLQDISMLNRMDYATDVLTKERIDISRMMADIVEETALAIKSKRMKLSNCLPEDVCIQGNWSLVYSIYRNLIDNAINYAGDGTTIEISAEDHDSHWSFTFRDNGMGVPAEHLNRIYRVDKGRSRQMGGTGLGLAIVKNAVFLHGGKISVSNAVDGGLQFDFTLKKQ
ncbi:MAG: hypothetical protein IJ647_08275 [Prevotella sp.]|nr:hypothetical protein [Prevotella sp.]